MYLLVVLACLQTDPAACSPVPLGVIPDRSAEACQINSRQRVTAWDRAEGGLTLRSWSCVPQPAQGG